MLNKCLSFCARMFPSLMERHGSLPASLLEHKTGPSELGSMAALKWASKAEKHVDEMRSCSTTSASGFTTNLQKHFIPLLPVFGNEMLKTSIRVLASNINQMFRLKFAVCVIKYCFQCTFISLLDNGQKLPSYIFQKHWLNSKLKIFT